MPFAGYSDFDACTRANSDKRDPEAYCAAIKRQVEGKAHAGVRFGNVGGDPFQDSDTLEDFLDALNEIADEVYIGDTQWPSDDYSIHDRPVEVVGIELDEAKDVWNEFAEDAVALGGPKLIDEDRKALPRPTHIEDVKLNEAELFGLAEKTDEWVMQNGMWMNEKTGDVVYLSTKEVPDDARNISSRDEAGENERVVEGPRGGLYAVGDDDSSDDSDGTVEVGGETWENASQLEGDEMFNAVDEGDRAAVEGRSGEEMVGTVEDKFDYDWGRGIKVRVDEDAPNNPHDQDVVVSVKPDKTPDDRSKNLVGINSESEQQREDFDVSSIQNEQSLDELGVEHPRSNITYGETEDGTPVFNRDEDEETVEAMKANEAVLQYFDIPVPRHKERDGGIAVQGIEGELAMEDPPDVNDDDLTNVLAANMLAGNYDLHGGNLMVDDTGDIWTIDTDHAGTDIDSREFSGRWDNSRRSIEMLDADVESTDVTERMQTMAEELDVDSVLSDIDDEEVRENIKSTVERARNGEIEFSRDLEAEEMGVAL